MIPGSRPGPVVKNQSMVLFNSAAGIGGIAYSNTVNTPVVGPALSLLKSTDKALASLGETLVYTLTARNAGNTAALVSVFDTLPPGVSFIANSVQRDGVPLPGATPYTGIPMGTLPPQAQVTVIFQVVVISLPPSLKLQNVAQGRFTFSTPEGRQVNGEIHSNMTSVSLLSYQLSIALVASTPTTFIGDVVTYTLLLRNEGNRLLYNINAIVGVPEGAVFIPGSVVAAGVYEPESEPATGIKLGTLSADAAAEISFRVRITSVPPSLTMTNRAVVTYEMDENKETTASNTAIIAIVQPDVTISKKVDLSKAAPGDQLSYQITLNNNGNLAVDAVLIDVIPSGTLFVWDSVRVNGVVLKGVRPMEGIPLGAIMADSEAVIEFQVSIPEATNVQQLPSLQNQANLQYTYLLPDGRTVRQNSSSNVVSTLLFTPIITLEIVAKPTLVEAGDLVELRTSLVNNGNWPAEVTLIRLAPDGTTLDPDSIRIDGLSNSHPLSNGKLLLGIVSADTTLDIVYFVTVNENVTERLLKGFIAAPYLFEIEGKQYSGEARSNGYVLEMEEISE